MFTEFNRLKLAAERMHQTKAGGNSPKCHAFCFHDPHSAESPDQAVQVFFSPIL